MATSPNKRLSRVAYLEDADEDSGSSVEGKEGTRQYAMSEAPVSPGRQQPNTSKSRADKRPPNSQHSSTSSSPTVSFTDSDGRPPLKSRDTIDSRRTSQDFQEPHAQARDRERERRRREKRLKEEEEDRRRDASAARDKQREREQESRTLKKTRPSVLKHSQTQPVVQQSSYKRGHVDESASYGVRQPASSSGSRPRAQTRPASYYAGQGSRPPIANMGWHHSQYPPAGPFPGTYPPPHMYPVQGMPPPSSHGGPPPASPFAPPPPGYFDAAPGSQHHGHLKQRFETRPSSAMGHQRAAELGYPVDDYDEAPPHLSRRPSRTKKPDEDRKRMPPPDYLPARPHTAAVPSTPFRPPPQRQPSQPSQRQQVSRVPSTHRRSVGFADQRGFDDSDFLGDELFQDSPEASYEQRRTALVRRPRRESLVYEDSGYEIIPHKSRGRRASMYGSSALGSGGVSLEEDKYLTALQYQDDVSGGPPMPLTAETLRNANKRGGVPSSRSTRSSESRDDSEFKRSNTTGITRSSSGNNDDVTIKLTGGAVLRVHGTEIACEGGEITLSSRPSGSRSGSDRASTVYQIEDSRSRVDRGLPHRIRAPSQSDSQSRGYATHAPYEPAFAPSGGAYF